MRQHLCADAIENAPGGVNSAAPLLALHLGGPILMGFISAVAFATILAVVAGLAITAAASFAHDIYASVIKKGKVEDPDAEVKIARRTVIVIGAVAIIGGIGVQGQNIAFLVALAFAVAASANLPTIVYSLFWKRFTTRGAVWSIYGGLGSAILLIAFSPVVSGSETAMIPGADFVLFPLSNPGIISIPSASSSAGSRRSPIRPLRAPSWQRRWTFVPTPDSAPRRLSNTECEKCCSYDVMFVRHDAEGGCGRPSVVREGWASLWGITAEHIHWGVVAITASPWFSVRRTTVLGFPQQGICAGDNG